MGINRKEQQIFIPITDLFGENGENGEDDSGEYCSDDETSSSLTEYYYNGSQNFWYGMPEFVSENLYNGFGTVLEIEFESKEDNKEFGENYLDEEDFWQEDTIRPNKGIWFPPKDRKRHADLVYINKDLFDSSLYEIVNPDEVLDP